MLPILFQFQVNLFQINLEQFFFECFLSFIISLYIAILRTIYMYLWTLLSTLAIMWHTYLIGVSFGLCNFYVKCKNILFLYIGYNVAYHSNCLAILFTTFKKPLSVIRMFWKKWKGVIWKQKHCKFDSYIHLTIICLDNEL